MRTIPTVLLGAAALGLGCRAPQPAPSPSPAPVRQKTELYPVGDLPAAAQEKATALSAAENRTQAAALVAALEPLAGRSADLSDLLASACNWIGAVDKALPLARQAVRLAPQSARLQLHLGQLEQQLGYSIPAEEHLRTAATLAPDAPEVHLALARFKERELHTVEAEREYREATAIDPQDPGLWGYLAENLLRQQKYDDARKALAEADRFAPDAPPGLVQRALIARDEARSGRGDRAEKWKEADGYLEKCLSLAPGYPSALFVRGTLQQDRGDDTGARASLEAALVAAPQLDGLKTQLGQVLVRLGEQKRGLELLAQSRQAQEHKDALERLVSRVAMQPKDQARRKALIAWCLSHGEPARARLEQVELTAPR
ncbi:tetratricopeptide repeat protein [Armatimonas rosea]|uniref:Tetratricopeptide (TPR) repeat protein n=1 Tax=Armatimonas rosea TaxID=685828 RepID=A0A7W9SM21_ARMRO|nr:tetratricopeptide repeat protein [Armatimonas rosea]MBB6048669.1 tetratricopeptide (TPR) repeat protein [Armatimonas rosea]